MKPRISQGEDRWAQIREIGDSEKERRLVSAIPFRNRYGVQDLIRFLGRSLACGQNKKELFCPMNVSSNFLWGAVVPAALPRP